MSFSMLIKVEYFKIRSLPQLLNHADPIVQLAGGIGWDSPVGVGPRTSGVEVWRAGQLPYADRRFGCLVLASSRLNILECRCVVSSGLRALYTGALGT